MRISSLSRRLLARSTRGFTLLEVMVSIAVLAVGLVVLLQAQARSIQMANHARSLTVATMLARSKVLDCETDLLKKGFSVGDYKEEGKFDEEGYDSFYWECHGYQPDLPLPDAASIAEASASAGSSEDGAGLTEGLQSGDPSGMMSMGIGMMAPVMSQISEVMKVSIRELVVIVKWKEGEFDEELRVATHVVDPSGIRAIAQQMQQMSGGGMGGLLDQLGGGGGGGDKGNKSPPPDNKPPRGK